VRVRAPRLEVAAGIIGALLVVVAAVVLHGTSSPAPQPVRASRHRGPPAVAHDPGPATPAGAVRAATSYLLELGNAAVSDPDRARQIAASIATGTLAGQLERALPALAGSIRARVHGRRAPAAFDGWPLGYRVEAFARSQATVVVWHLDVAASSALHLASVDYATTTYRLRFLGRAWRLEAVTTTPGPTPLPADASSQELDAFASAASSFTSYRYAP